MVRLFSYRWIGPPYKAMQIRQFRNIGSCICHSGQHNHRSPHKLQVRCRLFFPIYIFLVFEVLVTACTLHDFVHWLTFIILKKIYRFLEIVLKNKIFKVCTEILKIDL